MIQHVKDMADLYSRRVIAERLDVPEHVVARILGPSKAKNSRPGLSKAAKKVILAMRGKASVAEIATRFGVGTDTIYKVFRVNGVGLGRKPKAPKLRKSNRKSPGKITPEIRQQIVELRPSTN